MPDFSYEYIEDQIYQRLAPFEAADIEVRKLPEDQKELETDGSRPFKKGRITIGYKGSKWKEPRSTAQIIQEEKLIFEIAIQSRQLRGNRGVYLLKKLIKEALVGFQPDHCDRITADESGMTGTATQTDGVWTYSALFCCTTESVENFEEDLSIILTKITNNNDELGDSFEVPAAE
jgi:hypothetical protein